jgi:bifunctional DNase/RNase
MKNTLSAFGMEVTEVLIHKMVEGIFYAQLTVTDGIREEHIDSRSSDAVAVAVRFGCPIRCSQQVMEEAGVDLEGNEGEFMPEESEVQARPAKKKGVTLEELQKQLDEAIATENYELASELKKRIDDLKG